MENQNSTSEVFETELVESELEMEEKKEDNQTIDLAVTGSALPMNSNVIAERDGLVKQYYGANENLHDKVTSQGSTLQGVIDSVIQEMAKEVVDLKGNELYLLQKGDVLNSSVISVKRADILSLVTKVVQRKYELMNNMLNVDLNSPVFLVFQQICFDYLIAAMEENNVIPEIRQLVLTSWAQKMKSWDKDLKVRLDAMKNSTVGL